MTWRNSFIINWFSVSYHLLHRKQLEQDKEDENGENRSEKFMRICAWIVKVVIGNIHLIDVCTIPFSHFG